MWCRCGARRMWRAPARMSTDRRTGRMWRPCRNPGPGRRPATGAKKASRSRRWARASSRTTACIRRCEENTWTWWRWRRCPGWRGLSISVLFGTGVIAALPARRGCGSRGDGPGCAALGCARENLERLAVADRAPLERVDLFPRDRRNWWCATRLGCRRGPPRPSNRPCMTPNPACCAGSWMDWRNTWRRAEKAGLFFRTWPNACNCAAARHCWAGSRRRPGNRAPDGYPAQARQGAERERPLARRARGEVTSLWRLRHIGMPAGKPHLVRERGGI